MRNIPFGGAAGWTSALIAIPFAVIASFTLWRQMPKGKPPVIEAQ